MTNVISSPDDESASTRLVSDLRSEIADLEEAVEDQEFALPAGIRQLLDFVPVRVEVASAVDDAVARTELLSDDFAASLKVSLHHAQAQRGTGLVFLEHHFAHARSNRGIA